MAKKTNLLPYHITISGYAKMRNITRRSVYDKIKAGEIVVDTIGYSSVKMIDLSKYKDVSFENNNSSPTKIDLSICRARK